MSKIIDLKIICAIFVFVFVPHVGAGVLLIQYNVTKVLLNLKTFLLIFFLFYLYKQFNKDIKRCEHYCRDDVFALYVSHYYLF